jgi:myosin protein heavy chain
LQVEDLTVELENQRSSFGALEKKQRKFDQNLAEEKAVSERLVDCNPIRWSIN